MHFSVRPVVVTLVALGLSGCTGTLNDAGSDQPPVVGPCEVGDRNCTPPPGDTTRFNTRVWRLSPANYETELERLFGDQAPSVAIPGSASEAGISNIAANATIDTGNARNFLDAARMTGDWAVQNPTALRCSDYGTPACVDEVLAWLPNAAYRRPVDAGELGELRTLFDGLAAEFDYDYAMSGLVRTILLSPSFLYRTELGDDDQSSVVELTDHEIATLLAFAVTDRGPDEMLLAAAEAGRLRDPAGREAEAQRLMATSAPMWQRFFWEWMHLQTLDSQAVEVGLSPQLTEQVREEYDTFVDRIIVEDRGSLRDLLTTTRTWTRPELAGLYGADHS
ncbi:MAG: DUF1592 domain-containing protein, partial [Myxococcota bacterium]